MSFSIKKILPLIKSIEKKQWDAANLSYLEIISFPLRYSLHFPNFPKIKPPNFLPNHFGFHYLI